VDAEVADTEEEKHQEVSYMTRVNKMTLAVKTMTL